MAGGLAPDPALLCQQVWEMEGGWEKGQGR